MGLDLIWWRVQVGISHVQTTVNFFMGVCMLEEYLLYSEDWILIHNLWWGLFTVLMELAQLVTYHLYSFWKFSSCQYNSTCINFLSSNNLVISTNCVKVSELLYVSCLLFHLVKYCVCFWKHIFS
jgi:hypothetical protein